MKTAVQWGSAVLAASLVSVAAVAVLQRVAPDVLSGSEEPGARVLAVDMVRLTAALSAAARQEGDIARGLEEAADRLRRLSQAGILVIDTRTVVAAPESSLLAPADLVPGLPDASLADTLSAKAPRGTDDAGK